MDSHLLFELTYVFYRVCSAIINGERWLVESFKKFCLFYPPCKGWLRNWLNAFFITSVPTPLWEGLLRFLWWRCSFSQEKDSLDGVLDLCLYIVSSSSLEETLELEGIVSVVLDGVASSNHQSLVAWLYHCLSHGICDFSFENHFHPCEWYAHCLLDSFDDLFHVQDWETHLVDEL